MVYSTYYNLVMYLVMLPRYVTLSYYYYFECVFCVLVSTNHTISCYFEPFLYFYFSPTWVKMSLPTQSKPLMFNLNLIFTTFNHVFG